LWNSGPGIWIEIKSAEISFSLFVWNWWCGEQLLCGGKELVVGNGRNRMGGGDS
jgi:hypothetical protein